MSDIGLEVLCKSEVKLGKNLPESDLLIYPKYVLIIATSHESIGVSNSHELKIEEMRQSDS